jgi:hypothetical protein
MLVGQPPDRSFQALMMGRGQAAEPLTVSRSRAAASLRCQCVAASIHPVMPCRPGTGRAGNRRTCAWQV